MNDENPITMSEVLREIGSPDLIGERIEKLERENALLRKALEEAPHASDCHWRSSYCCCWKSRIPEARP